MPWHCSASSPAYSDVVLIRGRPLRNRDRLGTPRITVYGATFAPNAVRFIAHGVNAGCVNPAIVEVEQGANGYGVPDLFVRVTEFVQLSDIGRSDRVRQAVDLLDEVQQGFLVIGKRRAVEIGENARDEFLAAQQFRRDRGVRFRSKRALIQV